MKKIILIILLLLFAGHCFFETHIDGYGNYKEKKTIFEYHSHSEEVMEFCTAILSDFKEKQPLNIISDTFLYKDDHSKIWKPPVIL